MESCDRLERVERELLAMRRSYGRLRASVVGLLALLIVAGTMGATNQRERVVRANRVVLFDGNNRERGILEMGTAGPRLALYDEEGKLRVELVGANTAPRIRLRHANGADAVQVLAGEDSVELRMTPTEGGPVLAATVSNDGSGLRLQGTETAPELTLDNRRPTRGLMVRDRVARSSSTVFAGGIALTHDDGQQAMMLLREGGNVMLGVGDPELGMVILRGTKNRPGLAVIDARGHTRGELVLIDGRPYLSLFDEAGRTQFAVPEP